MAMIEKIWPSEQMAVALTNPSDNLENVDPADPQVSIRVTAACLTMHVQYAAPCPGKQPRSWLHLCNSARNQCQNQSLSILRDDIP